MIELDESIIEALAAMDTQLTYKLQEALEEVIECCTDQTVGTEDEYGLHEIACTVRAGLALLREYVDYACNTIER